MDEKGTWWPSSCLFPCCELMQHLMAIRCFFFFFINEKDIWQTPCVFFTSSIFFLICSLQIRRALDYHQVLFSSLLIKRALGGHHVLFFFLLLMKMALNSHQVFFFSLCQWVLTPSGHHVPFFLLHQLHLGAPSAFLFSLLTKNKASGH